MKPMVNETNETNDGDSWSYQLDAQLDAGDGHCRGQAAEESRQELKDRELRLQDLANDSHTVLP